MLLMWHCTFFNKIFHKFKHSHLALARKTFAQSIFHWHSTEIPITFQRTAFKWLLSPRNTARATKREVERVTKIEKRAFVPGGYLSGKLGFIRFNFVCVHWSLASKWRSWHSNVVVDNDCWLRALGNIAQLSRKKSWKKPIIWSRHIQCCFLE